MFIKQNQIPFEIKKEEVFSILDSLKNYNFKVKAYFLWLKAKNKLSEIDIDKAYNIIVSSMSEINQEEINRKFGMFEKNKEQNEKMKLDEQNEKMNEKIELDI